MTNTSQNFNQSYGYLCWLNGKTSYMVPGLQWEISGFLNPHAPADMFAAMGKNGQFINVVPSQNLVYIRMGNMPNGTEVPFLLNDSIWQRLNLVMCNTNTISQNADLQDIAIPYPNPFTHKIQVANLTETASFELKNVYGEMLFEGKKYQK